MSIAKIDLVELIFRYEFDFARGGSFLFTVTQSCFPFEVNSRLSPPISRLDF